jgi:hypothetical protein
LKNLVKSLKNELKGVIIKVSKKDVDPFVWKSL